MYSERATKFCESSTNYLYFVLPCQIIGGDFAKLCGLLRIYELYMLNRPIGSKYLVFDHVIYSIVFSHQHLVGWLLVHMYVRTGFRSQDPLNKSNHLFSAAAVDGFMQKLASYLNSNHLTTGGNLCKGEKRRFLFDELLLSQAELIME